MQYAMCPKCGRRLCKGEVGTKVEIECPKCGDMTLVVIGEGALHILQKLTETEKQQKKRA